MRSGGNIARFALALARRRRRPYWPATLTSPHDAQGDCRRLPCRKQAKHAPSVSTMSRSRSAISRKALAFYGRLFEFKLRGKSKTSAFIDLGDQFLALQKGRTQPPDGGRHFGLVVDDKDAVRRALAAAGVKPLPGPFLDFLDPWGNRVEIVGYDNIQFTKAPNVLRGTGLSHLSKTEQ